MSLLSVIHPLLVVGGPRLREGKERQGEGHEDMRGDTVMMRMMRMMVMMVMMMMMMVMMVMMVMRMRMRMRMRMKVLGQEWEFKDIDT